MRGRQKVPKIWFCAHKAHWMQLGADHQSHQMISSDNLLHRSTGKAVDQLDGILERILSCQAALPYCTCTYLRIVRSPRCQIHVRKETGISPSAP